MVTSSLSYITGRLYHKLTTAQSKMKVSLIIFLFYLELFAEVTSLTAPNIPSQELNTDYWNMLAKRDIDRRLAWRENNKIAKNVILFIGDGLGGTTITAARIFKGQLNGKPGEETVLKFEELPNVALSKTYNVNRQTADSAGTATAFLSGVKTISGILGLGPSAIRGDCPGSSTKHVENMVDWSLDAGKKVGIISTARITHATPGAAYANSADRNWEGDVDTAAAGVTCDDHAKQLIDRNPDISVIFGGGRRAFLPNNVTDPETGTISSKQRQDGRNLIEDWKRNMARLNRSHQYVWDKAGLDAVDTSSTDYILGLFEPSHMQYEIDRKEINPINEPSLAEMTSKAINIMRRNRDGYFLFVEGARIDHGHHDNLAKKALYDTLALEEAIKAALDAVNLDDTLVIVSADHSHVFDITGYAYRGQDLFDISAPLFDENIPYDDKPYGVLFYANGPGYNQERRNLSEHEMHDKNFVVPSGVPMDQETHGGEDVMIYADGPMAHLFHGVHEQNYIAHVMAYSACIGPYMGKCSRGVNDCDTSSASFINLNVMTYLIITLIFRFLPVA